MGGSDNEDIEAVIVHDWTFTWKPWSTECGDAAADWNPEYLVMNLKVMIVQTWGLRSKEL